MLNKSEVQLLEQFRLRHVPPASARAFVILAANFTNRRTRKRRETLVSVAALSKVAVIVIE